MKCDSGFRCGLTMRCAAGLALTWCGLEGLQSFDIGMTSALGSLSLYPIMQVGLVLGAVVLCVGKEPQGVSWKGRIGLPLAALFVMLLSFCLIWGGWELESAPLGVGGMLLGSIAWCAFDACWLLSLTQLGSKELKVAVACQGPFAAVLLLVFAVAQTGALCVGAIMLLAGALLLLPDRARTFVDNGEKERGSDTPKKTAVSTAKDDAARTSATFGDWTSLVFVIAGIAVLAMSFGYWQFSTLSMASAPPLANAVAAHLVSGGVFAFLSLACVDESFSTSLKLVCTLMAVAFAALVSNEGVFVVGCLASGIAFSLFEYVSTVALVGLVKGSRLSAGRVLGAWLLISCFAQLAGYTGGLLEAIASQTTEISFFGLFVVLAVVVAAIWWLTELRLTRFFDSLTGRSQEMAERADSAMRTDKAGDGLKASDPAAFIVVERGLTAREQEIVMMFASGRSATYIAETLFISISTVRTHLMHSYEKLGVHSRQELINVLFAGER